jgi:hypothetical protein
MTISLKLGDDLESKTERAFQNKLEDLADDSTEYKYWKFDTDYFKDPVIGYKQILNETKSPDQWDIDNPELVDYRTRYMSEEQKATFNQQSWQTSINSKLIRFVL